MIFFEKVTKRIAFAGNFRYTVTRIAPATCRFCVLLPKQLTPRQGTKTILIYFTLSTSMKQLTPRQGTKTLQLLRFCHQVTKQLTPRQGTKTLVLMESRWLGTKQLTPRQGTKTLQRRFVQKNLSDETTYAPPGDENKSRAGFIGFAGMKQLTPRQGTKTSSGIVTSVSISGNNLRPVRGRKHVDVFHFSVLSPETTCAPSGDENPHHKPILCFFS